MIGRAIIGLVEARNRRSDARAFEKRELDAIRRAGLSTREMPGETEWYEYWKPLMPFKCRQAYRLFAQRCGASRDIICESVIRRINTSLNHPFQNQAFRNKNFFDRIFPEGYMPPTILRRYGGALCDSTYHLIEDLSDETLRTLLAPYSRVVLKPSANTDSGAGVQLFERTPCGDFTDAAGHSLSAAGLLSAKGDFILQEALVQHPFMAAFNGSSVNTLRIATYRLVVDNKIHVLYGVIRMGTPGSVVDNAHAGGRMVRINMADGSLADFCADQYGCVFDSHGSVNFKEMHLTVPGWSRIKDFAIDIASRMDFSRLVQHDIMLDIDGRPRLIEVNVSYFSVWIPQLTGTTPFGPFTEEIRRYTLAHP